MRAPVLTFRRARAAALSAAPSGSLRSPPPPQAGEEPGGANRDHPLTVRVKGFGAVLVTVLLVMLIFSNTRLVEYRT